MTTTKRNAALTASLKLSEILARLMADNRVDAVILSKHTGIPPTTINRMRSQPDSNPTITTLIPIANFFSISVSQLIGTEPLLKSNQKRIWTTIPLLKWDDIPRWLATPSSNDQFERIYTDATATKRAFALHTRGDAMAPRFPEATLIIIDPELTPENRDFVIVRLQGATDPLFRQILLDGPECYLKPLNNDFQDTRRVELGKTATLIGVMVQARMDLRS